VPTVPPERTGVLVIRAWIEGERPSLRLRITWTLDVSDPVEQSATTTSVEEACAVVRRWLEGFEAEAPSVTGS
jgi:hypothetical protein